ncbi:MAG TPA: NAD(P)-dependent oxidoreductase [Cytophagaceae bacterium]|jgi:D-3-phosphoglycerate dehydrogenase
MEYRCLIVEKMHPSINEMLVGIGVVPDYRPSITKEEFYNDIINYDGLIVRSKFNLDADIIERATRLKFVARAGAGVDQIDLEAAAKRTLVIVNAPEGNRDALAEHAIGMLLCLMNKMHFADSQVRKGLWDREGNRGFEIKGKTIGLVGYGFMAKAFAQRLQSFGAKVVAYDKYLKGFTSELVEEVSLEQLFEQTDIVSFHIPLTKETKGMVDLGFLNSFQKNIWLLNTARGEVLVLKDLNKAIENGKVIGAALDVLENEKLDQLSEDQKIEFEKLVNQPNVLLTPHVGGWTHESYFKINQVLVEKIKQVLFSH